MVAKLAYRNLFHDRLSLFVTLVGIVFSVVLVAVQCGLYLGSEGLIAAVLDHVEADLWVVPFGTKSFDDPSMLQGREKHAALSTPGVASVEELVVTFVPWRNGTEAAASTRGRCWSARTPRPTSPCPGTSSQGSIDDLAAPDAVAVDRDLFQGAGRRAASATAPRSTACR